MDGNNSEQRLRASAQRRAKWMVEATRNKEEEEEEEEEDEIG